MTTFFPLDSNFTPPPAEGIISSDLGLSSLINSSKCNGKFIFIVMECAGRGRTANKTREELDHKAPPSIWPHWHKKQCGSYGNTPQQPAEKRLHFSMGVYVRTCCKNKGYLPISGMLYSILIKKCPFVLIYV